MASDRPGFESVFWDDLEADLKDPEFRAEFEKASKELSMSKWPLSDPGVYTMYGHFTGAVEAIVTADERLLVKGGDNRFTDMTELYLSGADWQFRKGDERHTILKDVQVTVNGAFEATERERARWHDAVTPLKMEPITQEEITEAYKAAQLATESGETMTTSSTGGKKAVKTARFDLIPARALWEVAEHFGRGAEKYGEDNWAKGIEWSKFFQAMQRHAWQFWSGEDYDPQMNSKHLAAVVFHAMVLMESMEMHPEFDNRPTHE
ncbi:dATP/dGTP diphosphohydrolase domain-containing protein [Nocardia jiangxiensis]|uniref:dATP/dGTP diphosphohydrolase domain-containing protein n=1 Tax=Nocardia jiangxiensis TaxID=282685 RepID=UPI0006889064|nr:dATP/dGTP diphosphohydrolase domain-containing protein [Nocardia jiangxiensis]